MTKAMPFLQKAILLSYDPRPLGRAAFLFCCTGDFAARSFLAFPLGADSPYQGEMAEGQRG